MDSKKHNQNSSYENTELLLAAVRERNVNEVKRLLKHHNVNLNCDIGDGSTVFFESLFCDDYEIFSCLIDAGCDINHARRNGERPLHAAVVNSPDKFVQELVKKGADMDVELHDFTPLHLAISLGKVEKACILLYYGNEVSATGGTTTPLIWAFKNNNMEIARMLFNYYDGFYCTSDYATTALRDAVEFGNPLVIDILKACNTVHEYSDCLRYSLENQNAELFRLIWSEFNKHIQLDEHFLRDFFDIGTCHFPYYEWLECLHVILNSSAAFELFVGCDNMHLLRLCENEFLSQVIFTLYKRNVPLNDRLAIIYLFLSLGIKITPDLVILTYLLYGFNEEVEAFLYTLNYWQVEYQDDVLVMGFNFVWKQMCQLKEVSQIFNVFDIVEHYEYRGLSFIENKENIIVSLLGFFSLSCYQKQELLEFCQNHLEDHQRVIRKLDTIPEIPSLLELCRNRAHQYLCQINNFSKPYEYYDTVKHLNLPSHIKNIMNFKTPLY